MRARVRMLMGLLAGLLVAGCIACRAGDGGVVGASEERGLRVEYGARGVERLTYDGRVLVDAPAGDDGFHIWHMRAVDARGMVLPGQQYGWGESATAKEWLAAEHAWVYRFGWGTVRVGYVQHGDALEIDVDTVNAAGSGIEFAGATVYPLTLRLPGADGGVMDGGVMDGGVMDNGGQPAVVTAGTDAVRMTVGAVDGGPLFAGLVAGAGGRQAVVMSGTRPEMQAGFGERPRVAPGRSDHFAVRVSFARDAAGAEAARGLTERAWGTAWPQVLAWPDRRAIGTVYLASSPRQGEAELVGNPRRYFVSSGQAVEVASAEGRREFARRLMDAAAETVRNLRRLGAQGVVVWDIEGEQYPQATSYACAPDAIGQLAPEMEQPVGARGEKLDDAYFRTLREAGFRVGVCVRPQRLVLEPGGGAHQQALGPDEAVAELTRKMRYAHERWGATIFYVDSAVDAEGRTLDPAVLEAAAKSVPDSLLIPEQSTERLYRAAAPFQSFLFHGETGTSVAARRLYPESFSANLVNDVDAEKLRRAVPALTEAVRGGDVLMVHADYWHPNNDVVMGIYRAAGR